MAIKLDELLGMNTKTRNDEQPIDRFPSYDDFARRTRSFQSDDRTSYNGFTSAPQSSGARSVEFLREHEAARPYTRPSQSEYQNYEYNLDSLRARRQAPVATTYVEPIAVEESVDTLYSYARADKDRPTDRELYDRLSSSGNLVSGAKPVEREERAQRTSVFTRVKTKQSSDTQKKARLNTKGKVLLGVYVAVIILVAVLIIVNAGDLNNGSATTPSSSISGVVSADTTSSNIISVPEIQFNNGTHTFFIK